MWLTLLSGSATTLITFMVAFLASQKNNPFQTWGMLMVLPFAFFCGLLLCRIVLVQTALDHARSINVPTESLENQKTTAVLKFWNSDYVLDLMAQDPAFEMKQGASKVGSSDFL